MRKSLIILRTDTSRNLQTPPIAHRQTTRHHSHILPTPLMVALLFYAYCRGIFSSRKIMQACEERLQFLRGTENLYIDIGYGTAEIRKLLDMVHEFYLKDIISWCKSNVDGIFFMDDWGNNSGPLINPEIFREWFKPLYKEYCDIIHSHGKFAFFHTDGNTQEIYGDFLEVGMDAINSQLFAMDIEELAKKYKGKVTFWGEMDRQYVMPLGSREEVRQAVRRVRKALDDGTGGVIAQCEWGKADPRENVETVFETWGE